MIPVNLDHGFERFVSDTALACVEGGVNPRINYRLTSRPLHNVTLDFTIDAPVYDDPNRERDYTLSTFRIVIEPPNWNVDTPLIVLQTDDVEEEEKKKLLERALF